MSQLCADIQECIDTFKRCVKDRFTRIEPLNLGGITKEMDNLRAEVRSVIERHMITISSVIPPVVQTLPLHGPKYFDLFLEEKEEVPIVGTMRVHEGDSGSQFTI